MKHAYDELYAGDVIIQQGGLFEYIARIHPNVDFILFVKEYMQSDLRSDIDVGWPKAAALLVRELYNRYTLKEGHSIPVGGCRVSENAAGWVGRFYAYYQWYWNIKSVDLVKRLTPEGLLGMYPGAHSKNMISVIKDLPPETLPDAEP